MRTRAALLIVAALFLASQVLLFSLFHSRRSNDDEPFQVVKERLHSVHRNVEHVKTPTASRLAKFQHAERHVSPAVPITVGPGATNLRKLQEVSVSARHPLDALQTLAFPAANEAESCVGIRRSSKAQDQVIAALVMVTFDRADYANRTLQSLLTAHNHHPDNRHRFPLYVSQDGDNSAVQEVVAEYLDHVHYLQHRELSAPIPESPKESLAYYRIANHYKFIFQTFFDCFGFDRLIIIEDDMLLAPDFFPFFLHTSRLLDRDPTLFCVSSWNDHGQRQFVKDETALARTDFFPGLGWLTTRQVWQSIKHCWPRGYWDDWMRLNATRQGRQCIRPEVSRTYNFGEVGSSHGQFFERYLKPMALASGFVDWESQNLDYLLPDRFEAEFHQQLDSARVMDSRSAWASETGPIQVLYSDLRDYRRIAREYRMMPEWKDAVPRASYRGVVSLRNPHDVQVFIAPVPGLDLRKAAEQQGALHSRRQRAHVM